jgi:hypothetical protein
MKPVSYALRSAALLALAFGTATAAVKPQQFVDHVAPQPKKAIGSVGADYVSPVAQPHFFSWDMRNSPVHREWRPGDPIKEVPRRRIDAEVNRQDPVNPVPENLDPLAELQRLVGAYRSGRAFVTPGINVAGIGDQGVSPPDTTGDVGPTVYIQSVNGTSGSRVSIFSKTTGALVVGPISMEGLPGVASGCTVGAGDPIILFDEIANRWVLTEFEDNNNNLCVFISPDADPSDDPPVGSPGHQPWVNYAFTFTAFPDYPKYGVWPDGYYVGANTNFGGSGNRPVCAFDRVRMLAGQPATMQCKSVPGLAGFGFEMLVPADLDGSALPPAGAGGIFMRHRDDETHNSGSNDPTRDFLELFQLSVDWTTPANTTLSAVHSIPVTEFSSNFEINSGFGQGFGALPQPNGNATTLGTQTLDPLLEVVMYRVGYRNFGTHESLVVNHVTDTLASTTRDVTGVRWYELRRSGSTAANGWTNFMEGTYSPDDTDRYMAGIAQDTSGNLAMAYSVVHDQHSAETTGDVPAGLRYVGRLSGDVPGVMSTTETVLQAGSGTQGNDRWGDYSQMSVDPVDGCTFWFTSQHMNGGSSRGTRVASFRHDECGQPTFTVNAAPTTLAICAASTVALPPVAITIGSVAGYTTPVNLGFGAGLPVGFTGSFTPPTVTPAGSSTLNLTAAPAAAAGANFVTVRGSSAGTDKDVLLTINVTNAVAAAPALIAPANGAANVAFAPVLSWTASPQAQTYTVEVATDAGFTNIVSTATIAGTSHTVTPALASNTTYFWRVRATNTCGTSSNSATFQFTTQLAPGACGGGTIANQVFFENFDGTATGSLPAGWVATNGTTGATGTRWQASTEQPFSGSNSVRSRDVSSASAAPGILLETPSINVPSGQAAATLQFRQVRNREVDGPGARCFDAGVIEVSANGGAYTVVPNVNLQTDPYTFNVAPDFSSPLAGVLAWCGFQASTLTIADLSSFAGQSIKVRFRSATDSSVVAATTSGVLAGWYLDDVKVQTCITAGPNAGPTISAPVALSGFSDTPLAITGFALADPDAGSANVTLTLAVDAGTLSATAGGSVAVTGSGTNTLVLTGSITALQTFVNGGAVQFSLGAGASGPAMLTSTINDQGNTGSGGPLSASAITPITIVSTAIFGNGFE